VSNACSQFLRAPLVTAKKKWVLDADIKGCVRRDSHHGIPEMIGRDEEDHL
jgi:hypothetical protein